MKFGGLLVALVALAAIAAPLIAHRDPLATSALAFAPPLTNGLFGTDNLGRDVWSEVVYGGRVSLIVGIGASLLQTVIGVVIGGIAGYRGGVVDLVLMRVSEFFQIIPQFFLAWCWWRSPDADSTKSSLCLASWRGR